MSFASDTSIEKVDENRYRLTIVDGWDIFGVANGGYVFALMTRACLAATGREHPVSVTTHFLAPGPVGEALIETHIIKSGRRFTSVRAELRAAGRVVAASLASCGSITPDHGPAPYATGRPPTMPTPEECIRLVPTSRGGSAPELAGRYELLVHPEDTSFMTEHPSGEATMRGWFRLVDDEPLDSVVVGAAMDAFPLTVFNTGLSRAWTPTLELTCHLRAIPTDGWLRGAFVTRFVQHGMLEVDGELWDERDQLVAQSRQLLLVPIEST